MALIPNSERSREELAAMGRKGGLAAAEKRRARKNIRETLSAFLDTEVKIDLKTLPDVVQEVLNKSKAKQVTLKEAGLLELAARFAKGDLKAILLGAKMIGEYSEDIALQDVNEEDEATPIRITVTNEEGEEDLEEAYADRVI